MDIARGEAVEKELDAMIERRSRQKDPEEESELGRRAPAGTTPTNRKR